MGTRRESLRSIGGLKPTLQLVLSSHTGFWMG